MSKDTTTAPRYWTQPRYWPTYLAITAMRASAWLPWRCKLALGRLIGLAAWRFAGRRRHITETNIRLCFPELDPAAQARLVKQSFLFLATSP